MYASRNKTEQSVITFLNVADENNVKSTIIKLLVKSVFEIYDYVGGTQHALLVNDLYFNKGAMFNNLEKTAQKFHVDISTLRRYRKRYIKILFYIQHLPEKSSVVELIEQIKDNF